MVAVIYCERTQQCLLMLSLTRSTNVLDALPGRLQIKRLDMVFKILFVCRFNIPVIVFGFFHIVYLFVCHFLCYPCLF